MKHEVIAMKLCKEPRIEISANTGETLLGRPINQILRETPLELPPGCTGIVYVFESEEAARDYYGPDVELAPIQDEGEDDEF